MRKQAKEYELLLAATLILVIVVMFSYFITQLEWEFADWTYVFYPAGRSFWQPYFPITLQRELYFFNPPWMAWLLAPFTLFPVRLALAIWLTFTLVLATWCIHRLGGGIYEVILVLCSPVFLRLFIHAQIDVVVLLGFTLLVTTTPIYMQGVGIVFLVIKPQVLFLGAFVHWFHLSQQNKLLLLAPLAVITLISFLFYGFWLSYLYQVFPLLSQTANVSIWPYGIPVGLVLLGLSIKRGNVYLGAFATYFLSPYVISHSLFAHTAIAFTQLSKKWSGVLFVLLWILALWAT